MPKRKKHPPSGRRISADDGALGSSGGGVSRATRNTLTQMDWGRRSSSVGCAGGAVAGTASWCARRSGCSSTTISASSSAAAADHQREAAAAAAADGRTRGREDEEDDDQQRRRSQGNPYRQRQIASGGGAPAEEPVLQRRQQPDQQGNALGVENCAGGDCDQDGLEYDSDGGDDDDDDDCSCFDLDDDVVRETFTQTFSFTQMSQRRRFELSQRMMASSTAASSQEDGEGEECGDSAADSGHPLPAQEDDDCDNNSFGNAGLPEPTRKRGAEEAGEVAVVVAAAAAAVVEENSSNNNNCIMIDQQKGNDAVRRTSAAAATTTTTKVYDRNGIQFNVGETWVRQYCCGNVGGGSRKSGEHNYVGEDHHPRLVYYRIRGFVTKRMELYARCPSSTYVPLSDTFIGPKQAAAAITTMKSKCQGHQHSHLVKLADPINAGVLEEGDLVRLVDLNYRCMGRGVRTGDDVAVEPPEPSIYFECRRKKGTVGGDCGHYSFAYSNRYEFATPISCRPVVLDLFAGGGGMSLGLHRAGMEVRFAVEIDPHAAATLRSNPKYSTPTVFEEDVRVFLDKARSGDPCYPKKGEVNHIHSSSPCQGVSRANRKGNPIMDKENNELAFVIVDFIDYYRPETGTFENVPGMLDRKNRHYLQELIRRLIEIDYQVRLCLVDASNYQDPQNRKRIVLLVARHDVKLPDAAAPAPSPLPKRTVWDALGDLERVEPVHGSGFVMINGRRVSDHNVDSTNLPDRYEKKRMYGNDYNRSNSSSEKASTDWTELVADSQASTILRQRPVVHYSGRRCLTVRERARLQSFPDDYRFCGTNDARKDQIGNAVPVGLAEAIGLAFMRESYEVYPPDEAQLNGVTY